jgi:type IV pilus assembly protein PilY1
MNLRIKATGFGRALAILTVAMLAPGWNGWQVAQADATSISTQPIFAATAPSVEIKPNVMFVLDDSGSMDWGYMPDTAGDFVGNYGYASSQCNGIYYNPSIT